MLHIRIITAIFDIIWQNRVLPGTRNIFKRVFIGTLCNTERFITLNFSPGEKTKNSFFFSKMVKNLGTLADRYLQVLPNTDRYFA